MVNMTFILWNFVLAGLYIGILCVDKYGIARIDQYKPIVGHKIRILYIMMVCCLFGLYFPDFVSLFVSNKCGSGLPMNDSIFPDF